jgi:hypothetical protein
MPTELAKHARSKTIAPNVTTLSGFIEITAAGAINAQSGQRDSGVTFVKNATAGRYDGTIHRAYRRAISTDANMVGPTAGTVPNAAKQALVTGIAAAAWGGTSGFSTFTIQCTAADGATATNPTSGDIIIWELVVSDSQRA